MVEAISNSQIHCGGLDVIIPCCTLRAWYWDAVGQPCEYQHLLSYLQGRSLVNLVHRVGKSFGFILIYLVKSPQNVPVKGRPFKKNTWKVIRQTFCLSHWSKPVNFVLLPVKPGSYSLKLSVDARREISLTSLPPGDSHLSVYQNSGLLIRAFQDG